jgi:hypothetical protein
MLATTRWVTTAAVADHADRLAVAGEQCVGGVAHVAAGGGVGGQHPALGGLVVEHHVDADGARRVKALDSGQCGHVQAKRRHQDQCSGRRCGCGFDAGAQVFEQLEKLGAACRLGRHPNRWQRGHLGHGRFRRALDCALRVRIKTRAHFFAQHATGQALCGDDAGPIAWLFEVLVVNRLHHGVRHIKRGQVHELKRAEAKPHLILEDAVGGGEIGHPFAHQPQSLGAVAPTGVVDDKARRVLGRYRRVTELPGICRELSANLDSGLEARDHLNHAHQRHRVEEVVARELLRSLKRGGDGGDRQRRGVGGQHRVWPHDALQLGKQLAFHLQLLHHRFDHQITRRKRRQVVYRAHPIQVGVCLGKIESSLACQCLPGGLQRAASSLGGAGLAVVKKNFAACLGRHLSDAPAHRAGSDQAGCVEYGLHRRCLLKWEPTRPLADPMGQIGQGLWWAVAVDRHHAPGGFGCLGEGLVP